MSTRQRKAIKAVAAFLILSVAQVGIRLGYAAGTSATAVLPIPQQLIVARLERVRGAAITVNGSGVAGGATITTASTIETGADTVATVNLGSLGTLDIAPNTRLELTYDDQGNVKVKLITGCAVLRTKKGNGEITTENGTSTGQNKNRGILDVCIPPGGGQPIVNQGAAAAATSAGAAAGGGAAGGAGLGTAAIIAIVAGASAAVVIPIAATHGGQGNTSGSTSL